MLENQIAVVIKGVTPAGKLTPEDIKEALEKYFIGKFEVKDIRPDVGGGFKLYGKGI